MQISLLTLFIGESQFEYGRHCGMIGTIGIALGRTLQNIGVDPKIVDVVLIRPMRLCIGQESQIYQDSPSCVGWESQIYQYSPSTEDHHLILNHILLCWVISYIDTHPLSFHVKWVSFFPTSLRLRIRLCSVLFQIFNIGLVRAIVLAWLFVINDLLGYQVGTTSQYQGQSQVIRSDYKHDRDVFEGY